jgi:MarR family transcriptional regulator, transcriptional regulator for hemolysin
LFSMMTKKYIALVTEQLKSMDIERHFYVVHVLAVAEKPFTQKDLASFLDIDKTSMVRVVDYLSQNGYLQRVANPQDRREYFIELTAKGTAANVLIEAAFEAANNRCLIGFSATEREALTNALDRLKCNLCEVPSTDLELKFEKRKRNK